MSLDDMHDDEIRAKLGLAPLGRRMTVEERILVMNLREMPEPFETEEAVLAPALTGVVGPEQRAELAAAAPEPVGVTCMACGANSKRDNVRVANGVCDDCVNEGDR